MSTRTWVILGGTSIIAEEFANLAAEAKQNLILVGRNRNQLDIIAANISLRYKVSCSVLHIDFVTDLAALLQFLQQQQGELDLFIAFSDIVYNAHLSSAAIKQLLLTNVVSTVEIIHSYLQRRQEDSRIIFLSSVAAARGRNKNSLYGGSKAAVEVFLEGLQQTTQNNMHITIARLGFIDTKQTYGLPGIFYASSPKACARACWQGVKANKRLIYHPSFWRLIMWVIAKLPFFIYKKLKM